MKEIWKDIIGFEKYYKISTIGNIFSKRKQRIIIGDVNNVGYRRVTLYGLNVKRFFIHRLVAEHFIEKISNKNIVNHIDGDKQNNIVENLEWCTRSENDIHALQLQLRNPWNASEILQKDKEGNVIKKFTSLSEAERITGFCRRTISNKLNTKMLYKSYYWESVQ